MRFHTEEWRAVPPCAVRAIEQLTGQVERLTAANRDLEILCKTQFEAISSIMTEQGVIVSHHMDRNDREIETLQNTAKVLEHTMEGWKRSTDAKIRDMTLSFGDKRTLDLRKIEEISYQSQRQKENVDELYKTIDFLEKKMNQIRNSDSEIRNSDPYPSSPTAPNPHPPKHSRASRNIGNTVASPRNTAALTSEADMMTTTTTGGSSSSSSSNNNHNNNSSAQHAQQTSQVMDYVDKAVGSLQQQIKQLRLNQEKANRMNDVHIQELTSSNDKSFKMIRRKLDEDSEFSKVTLYSLVEDVKDLKARIEEERSMRISKMRSMDESVRSSMTECEDMISMLANKIDSVSQEVIMPAKSMEKSLRVMQDNIDDQKRQLSLSQKSFSHAVSKVNENLENQRKFVQAKLTSQEKEMHNRINNVISLAPGSQATRSSAMEMSVTARVQQIRRRRKRDLKPGAKTKTMGIIKPSFVLDYNSASETRPKSQHRVSRVRPEIENGVNGRVEVEFSPRS